MINEFVIPFYESGWDIHITSDEFRKGMFERHNWLVNLSKPSVRWHWGIYTSVAGRTLIFYNEEDALVYKLRFA